MRRYQFLSCSVYVFLVMKDRLVVGDRALRVAVRCCCQTFRGLDEQGVPGYCEKRECLHSFSHEVTISFFCVVLVSFRHFCLCSQ